LRIFITFRKFLFLCPSSFPSSYLGQARDNGKPSGPAIYFDLAHQQIPQLWSSLIATFRPMLEWGENLDKPFHSRAIQPGVTCSSDPRPDIRQSN
jgi:hypothetical protein